MLTGEYFVLDGALALALPTKPGQSMAVKFTESDDSSLSWSAFDVDGELWYSQNFNIDQDRRIVQAIVEDGCNIDKTTDLLTSLLNEALRLNDDFMKQGSYEVQSHLDFPIDWGLGSSSTMICNIAKWAEVDAFDLLKVSFGGSGYDIAVGMMGGDVLYRSPELWEGYVFRPPFVDRLYFVHLNRKQDSREAIAAYKAKPASSDKIEAISNITDMLSVTTEFNEFQDLINQHEQLISEHMERPTVKSSLFSDYPYAIKSLGGWGGDFILACGDGDTDAYFRSKGYDVVMPYTQLIK